MCANCWCRLVHILALGVFWSGFVKDFYSLPRPLSPPLQRITMSGSVALEYGFPSTHSANAVSVAVYGLLLLHSPDNAFSPNTKLSLEILSYFYAVSIVLGRLYCGMHGFLDVIVGSALGAVFGYLEFAYGPSFDAYMHSCSWLAPFLTGLLIITLIRIHPVPADDCPCFDDSVAFVSVVIGVEFGTWTYGKIPGDPWNTNAYADASVDVFQLGLILNMARILLGVFTVFAWRGTMKPLLFKTLPRLFRLIEQSGMSLPRRFFTPASEYKSVPTGSRIDTLFPEASDFPRMVQGIRHPTTRGRSVSIGPQSAADAYEALAYRERQRRESAGSAGSVGSGDAGRPGSRGHASGAQKSPARRANGKEREDGSAVSSGRNGTADVYGNWEDALEEEEEKVFSRLPRPRVRYDVEVVTKLVVYTGKHRPGWSASRYMVANAFYC